MCAFDVFTCTHLCLRVLTYRALPLGVVYSLNIGVGLLALQSVNIPMFNSLRKLVAPIILLYEYFVMGKVADCGIQVSVWIIVAGVILAGWDTLASGAFGYVMAMCNNVLTAASSTLVSYAFSMLLPRNSSSECLLIRSVRGHSNVTSAQAHQMCVRCHCKQYLLVLP